MTVSPETLGPKHDCAIELGLLFKDMTVPALQTQPHLPGPAPPSVSQLYGGSWNPRQNSGGCIEFYRLA